MPVNRSPMLRIIRDGVPPDPFTRQMHDKFMDTMNQIIDERNADLKARKAEAAPIDDGKGTLLATFNDLSGTAVAETTIWTPDDDYTISRIIAQLSEVQSWLSVPTIGFRVTPTGGVAADIYAAAALSTGGNDVDEVGEKYVFQTSGYQASVQAGFPVSANVTVAGTVGAGGFQKFRIYVIGYRNTKG